MGLHFSSLFNLNKQVSKSQNSSSFIPAITLFLLQFFHSFDLLQKKAVGDMQYIQPVKHVEDICKFAASVIALGLLWYPLTEFRQGGWLMKHVDNQQIQLECIFYKLSSKKPWKLYKLVLLLSKLKAFTLKIIWSKSAKT